MMDAIDEAERLPEFAHRSGAITEMMCGRTQVNEIATAFAAGENLPQSGGEIDRERVAGFTL